MAKKMIEIDGILIEVSTNQNEIEMLSSSSNDVIEKVDNSIINLKSVLLKAISPIVDTYKELNKDMSIEKAEVEVGIGFSAKGNIFIASGEGNANLNIKLTLSAKDKKGN